MTAPALFSVQGWCMTSSDAAASAPYEHLGPVRTARLIELVRPWARSLTKQIFG